MQDTPGRSRRRHPAALKAQILADCAQPGASIARIALEHGINANVVHRWRRIAEGRERGPHAKPRQDAFVPLPIVATPTMSAPADIRIELRRGTSSVTIAWPTSAASECARWLRELVE